MASPDRADDLTPAVVQALVAHKQEFLRFLQRRIDQPDLAAEILQDAFLKGVEKGSTLHDDESALSFCYRLLRNAVIDRYRRASSEKAALARLAQELDSLNAVDADLEREVCTCMTGLIGTLKPEYAGIVRRVDLDGVTLDAFAAAERITVNNATVRLHRARRSLRQRLEQLCGVCAHHGCLNCTCSQGSCKGL